MKFVIDDTLLVELENAVVECEAGKEKGFVQGFKKGVESAVKVAREEAKKDNVIIDSLRWSIGSCTWLDGLSKEDFERLLSMVDDGILRYNKRVRHCKLNWGKGE